MGEIPSRRTRQKCGLHNGSTRDFGCQIVNCNIAGYCRVHIYI
jgi:hypothetical protein